MWNAILHKDEVEKGKDKLVHKDGQRRGSVRLRTPFGNIT